MDRDGGEEGEGSEQRMGKGGDGKVPGALRPSFGHTHHLYALFDFIGCVWNWMRPFAGHVEASTSFSIPSYSIL